MRFGARRLAGRRIRYTARLPAPVLAARATEIMQQTDNDSQPKPNVVPVRQRPQPAALLRPARGRPALAVKAVQKFTQPLQEHLRLGNLRGLLGRGKAFQRGLAALGQALQSSRELGHDLDGFRQIFLP